MIYSNVGGGFNISGQSFSPSLGGLISITRANPQMDSKTSSNQRLAGRMMELPPFVETNLRTKVEFCKICFLQRTVAA